MPKRMTTTNALYKESKKRPRETKKTKAKRYIKKEEPKTYAQAMEEDNYFFYGKGETYRGKKKNTVRKNRGYVIKV